MPSFLGKRTLEFSGTPETLSPSMLVLFGVGARNFDHGTVVGLGVLFLGTLWEVEARLVEIVVGDQLDEDSRAKWVNRARGASGSVIVISFPWRPPWGLALQWPRVIAKGYG